MKSNRIVGMGRRYADGREALEIAIGDLPATVSPREGYRVTLTVQIGSEQYIAGMRSTAAAGVWLCPDLRDSHGRRVSLAQVLDSNGLRKNQAVRLSEDQGVVAIRPT
jgi:hypothetical protein